MCAVRCNYMDQIWKAALVGHSPWFSWLVGLISWCLPIPLPCGLPALVRCSPGAFFMVDYFAFHYFTVDYFAFPYCLSNNEISIPLTFIFFPRKVKTSQPFPDDQQDEL